MLAEMYRRDIDSILAKYPADQKRSAVMPLLFLAQREYGYLTPGALEEIAALLDITPTQVAAVVGFYTLFHDKQAGVHRLQVCTDLPCALCGADEFVQQLCEHMGVQPGGTTADGMFTVEEVMCLAACDQAPLFQVQTRSGIFYYENQTLESTKAVLAKLRAAARE